MPKTLRERLDELDPDELRHVADFWAVSLEERPADQCPPGYPESLLGYSPVARPAEQTETQTEQVRWDDPEKPHQPSAFRLTPLGAVVLGEERAWPIPERICVTQPNFEVLLTQAKPVTLYCLLEVAEPLGFDRMGRLRFTRERALSAAEGGKTAAQVLADLSVCSQNAVPQNVAVTIREWMGEGRPIHLTIGWLLEVDEAETAQAILTDRTLHRYVERAVRPTALLLRAGVSEEQISTALRKAGFFPRVTR